MKKIIFAFILFSTLAFSGEGSIYSQYGIGEIISGARGKNIGLGGTGVGIIGESYINFANPATIGTIRQTIFDASYQFNSYKAEDNSASSKIFTGNINEFGLALPVYSPKKIVAAIGFLPYSIVGYDQRVDVIAAGQSITQQFEGRGGLSSVQLSLSYSPFENISFGITGQYLVGAIYRDFSLHFGSSDYYGGSYNQTLSISGYAATLGILVNGVENILGLSGAKAMNVGATFFTGSTLSLDEEILRNYSSNQDTLTFNNQTINLPWGFSLGISYLNRSVLYAADISFQNWDRLKIGGVHAPQIKNNIQVGGGIEFLQSNNINDSFLEKVSSRIGGYFQKTNVSINGNSINEVFVTGGIGFPISFDSRINLGLEYGIRGKTSSSLVKDNIIRFTVSLTASELMFIPPAID